MPTFEVIVEKTEKYVLKLSANSESEAVEKAEELLEVRSNQAKFHDDSSVKAEAFEI